MIWWESLSNLGRIFACIAVPFTAVLLVQTIMLLFGFSGDHSDGDGSHVSMDHDISHGDSAMDHDISHSHDGTDAQSVDSHPHQPHSEGADLRLFSIRGIISFMVVLGWIGLILDGALPKGLVILISLALGFGALYLTAKIFQWSRKLQSSGNIKMENAVGAEAQVYLTIPASMSGKGKVEVLVQQRLVECDAVTTHDMPLRTGSTVMVVGIRADDTLIVEPK